MGVYKLATEEQGDGIFKGNQYITIGHRLYTQYEEWVAQGNTPDPADPAPDTRVADIKAYAGSLIEVKYPAWKQRNMIARSVELAGLATLTATEQAERDAIAAIWVWVKAVRAVSNTAEVAGTKLIDINWTIV